MQSLVDFCDIVYLKSLDSQYHTALRFITGDYVFIYFSLPTIAFYMKRQGGTL